MAIKPENYRIVRNHFIKLLGQKCAVCGVECDEIGNYIDNESVVRKIEFDHIKPNGIYRSRIGTAQRVWEWFDAYANSNLQLLCRFCNSSKNDKEI